MAAAPARPRMGHLPFSERLNSSHIPVMAKNPEPPKKSVKTPKSKAHRPEVQPIGPALAELLNPAINRGESGMGSGTGLQPPPDNSWDRRSGGEAAAHRARASTPKNFPSDGSGDAYPLRPNPQPAGARKSSDASKDDGFDEAPQANYGTTATIPDARSGTGQTARFHHRGGRRRRNGAAPAQQDGGARRRRHRRRAGGADPRRPSRIQGQGWPEPDLDPAPAAAPGEIRRRRARS